jgi:RNA polymerase sigma factor (sigma-70 family)
MPTTTLGTVVHQLRRTVLANGGVAPPDCVLLESFIASRDEIAFEGLVRRHGPMVLGVCRRILRNEADAEDAFQATFLVLVRRAAAIRPRAMVGNFLYGVANHTALRARAMRTKRLTKEREAVERVARPEPASGVSYDPGHRGVDIPGHRGVDTPRSPTTSTQYEEDLHALLDQELKVLPDIYRAAIVLCDLEGKSIKEAARQLGCPQGTVGTRLARGRRLLSRRLARRGMAMSGSVMATAIAQNIAKAGVPPLLMNSTIKAACLIAAGQAAASSLLSLKAVALAEGVLKTMLLKKLKSAVAVLLALAVIGGGAAALTQQVLAKSAAPAMLLVAQAPTGVQNEAGVVSGIVKAVDVEKNSLTIIHKDGDRTFTVAKDAAIVNNGRPGTLPELPIRAFVTLGLLADQTARSVEAVGPNAWGVLKTVDADKRTLTFDDKGLERTLTMTKNANILIDDHPAKLSDLPLGAQVTLSWFQDQKTARRVEASGRQYFGVVVKAVDGPKNTITFGEERAPAEVAGKTFPVAKHAIIRVDGEDGKPLAAIPAGALAHPILSADQKTVTYLTAEGRSLMGGLVKSVDGTQNTITFDEQWGPPELAGKTFPVAKNANIQIDGKEGKLSAVPPRSLVNPTFGVDQKTIRMIQAEGRQFMGVPVKAVDAVQNTITIDDNRAPTELAGKTFPVVKDAAISIDGKPAKLASVPPGVGVNLVMSADHSAARQIAAEGRAFPGALVKAVDANQNTITFDGTKTPSDLAGKTVSVAKDATISVDGKPGRLAAIPAGATISLTLTVDQKVIRMIAAGGWQIGAQGAVVDSVDADKNTITVDINGEGHKTFPVAPDAFITIDNKPAKLAAVAKEATVLLTLKVDQKTVGWIEAKSP